MLGTGALGLCRELARKTLAQDGTGLMNDLSTGRGLLDQFGCEIVAIAWLSFRAILRGPPIQP